MSSVEIEYCVPCGFRDRALDVAEEILQASENDLDDLSLVTGAHGVFEVRVDGKPVYDKDEQAFESAEIAAAVAEAL